MPKIRHSTVQQFFSGSYQVGMHTWLRLRGKWLAEAGFAPGDKVLIVPVDGMLVVVKADQAKGGD